MQYQLMWTGAIFLNPFSVEILQKVLARIYESYYENSKRNSVNVLLSVRR